MTQTQILDAVESKIEKYQPSDFRLLVQREGARHEGDWWYVVVTSSDPEARASAYTHAVSQVEDDIEEELGENVLLVPSLVD